MIEPKGFKLPAITEEDLENLPEELKKFIKPQANKTSSQKLYSSNPVAKQIDNLKNKLSSTDYKIIKCYEYNLAGLDIPYDITFLHQEREELRNQIRELEKGE